MPILVRVSDGAGDSGACVQAIKWKEDGRVDEIVDNRPVVGCSLLVGSFTARSYSGQDYWLTTPVTKILEESPGLIRFMTRSGSEYLFKYDGEIPPFKKEEK